MYGTAYSCALVSVPKHSYRRYQIIDFIGNTPSSSSKNASRIKANLEFHQSSDDFIVDASPPVQFVHSFRLAQISGAVGGNGQFDGHSRWLYFLFGFFEGGVDDGEGEWNLLVYLTEIIHKMRG